LRDNDNASAPTLAPAAGPGPGAAVSLREVTAETVRAICLLQVAEHQKSIVAPNAQSIAQAYFHRENAWFRAIYAGEEPVGFVMLWDEPEKARYFLWRFMIDARYQRLGYGSRALELVIDHIKTRPGATHMTVTYDKIPAGPEGFYRRRGFVETGETIGTEHVAKLVLS
jgi:diamine N-acetyltransferase